MEVSEKQNTTRWINRISSTLPHLANTFGLPLPQRYESGVNFKLTHYHGLVYVTGQLVGPTRRTRVRLALDTGCSQTVIRPAILAFIGCRMADPWGTKRVTTVTGRHDFPVIQLDRITVLGRHLDLPRVLAYEPPERFEGQGLLGLDFLEGSVLTLDMYRFEMAIRPPRPWWHFWP
jgi:hypothetical protein